MIRIRYTDIEAHQAYFEKHDYSGTATCLECDADMGSDILKTGHWNWQGIRANIEGVESEVHGKRDIINNFCIAVLINESRCAQCHIGYGYVDKTLNFQYADSVTIKREVTQRHRLLQVILILPLIY